MELEGFGDPAGFFDFVHAPFSTDNVGEAVFLDGDTIGPWTCFCDGSTPWTTATGGP